MNRLSVRAEIEKVAKESTYLQDFISGFDPTGVSTFRNAMGNEKNHGTHIAVGDAGGFVGGAVVGTAMPAGITALAAKALKSKNPELAKELMIMAKGSIDAYNPNKIKKYLKSFSELPNLKTKANDFSNASDDVLEKVRNLKTGKVPFAGVRTATDAKESYDKLESAKDAFDAQTAKMRNEYYDGKPVPEGMSRAMTAVTSLGMAGVTGGLNAASSHLQYGTALKEREKNRNL